MMTIRKIIYRMSNGTVNMKGNTTINDYKYILQHSSNIQFKGKDVYCTYNEFHCIFIF